MKHAVTAALILTGFLLVSSCAPQGAQGDVDALRQQVKDLQGRVGMVEDMANSLELQNRSLRERLDESLGTVFQTGSGIVVQEPKPFDEVQPGFVVSGYAWVFEGTVSLVLVDAKKNELGRTIATGGGGSFEHFTTTVDFDTSSVDGEPLTLQAYSESARGTGEKLALVETPLHLKDQ